MQDLKPLKLAAEACHGWSWPDRRRDENGTHHFGKRSEDGEFYEIGTIYASNYTLEYADDLRVLKFLRLAQPAAVLSLVTEVEQLRRDKLELQRRYDEQKLQEARLDDEVLRLHRQLAAAPQPAASVTDVAKDAARWQQMLRHVGADRSPAMGCQYFVFRGIHAEPGVDLMRGSVAGHFTDVIDAAIAAQQGEK